MEAITLTPAAEVINNIFFALDYQILAIYHALALACPWITPIMVGISYTAKSGIPLIIASLVMICFKKTRRTGIYCLAGLTVGAILVNVIVKPLIMRPRPYVFNADIRSWWEMVGSHTESDGSFPSGHTNAAADFSVAFCYANGKKYIPWAILYIVLMGISRNWLQVHYPSDVLFGMIFGIAAGFIAGALVTFGYKKFEERKSIKNANPEK